ncbi:hypothetical protein MNBD_ALPHA09-1225 [hydrothermal vent metagenome]|uniref:Outer membrane protein/protective antigen OMA87 n=1 Tax=hydrothermal vent metagenome TaxID=652676 RepID=A0A3B0T5T2_9ZZZZ
MGLGLCLSGLAVGPLSAQTVAEDAGARGAGAPAFLFDDPWVRLRALFLADGTGGGDETVDPGLPPPGAEAVQGDGPARGEAAGLPAQLQAQEAEAGGLPGQYRAQGFERRLETVADRRRAELDPAGLKMGTFTLFPEVQISGSSTDNVFTTATGKKSDTIVALRPSFALRSDWRRHALILAGEGEWGIYGRYKSENVLRGSLAGEARADLTPFVSASLRLSIASDQEGRGSPDANAGATEPGRLLTYGAQASLSRRFNRLVATLRGGLALTDYDDVELVAGGSDNNDDRDVGTNTIGLRLAYEVSPAASVYGDLEFDARSYRQRLDDDGFQRSSDGWRAAIGTNVEVGRLARLDLQVGYVARDYEDTQLAGIGAVTADGLLTWSMTPLTTLRLGAGSDVEETTVAGASARVTRRVVVGADHELLRNLTLGAEVSFENQRLLSGDAVEETDTISASFGGEYRLSREAALVARIAHEVERPDDDSGNITETVASVGLTLRR